MKTFMQKKETVERNWYVVDATGKTLGRLATQVATVLRGKNKPTYTPHVDCGDYVIVVNADKVVLTGNKLEDKKYYNHSGYPGGLRERSSRTASVYGDLLLSGLVYDGKKTVSRSRKLYFHGADTDDTDCKTHQETA
mgnify:CR=1 FL=1